ncbi:MAG: HAMP domain-containing histidine kinase [Clostridiales bacterium]|nr:HAMP domain-containing sensor histidine kinase [Bacillota bacterium]NLL53616.1 HAMP domain-containing histidine kinase [Clostridiales bacterium]
MMYRGNRLFWRLLWAFLLTLLVTAAVMSLLMVMMVRQERSLALENELQVQARDVAKMLEESDDSLFRRWDSGLSNTLNWKIREIRETYGAEVWLVSSGRRVWVLGDTHFDQEQISDPGVVEQVDRVLSGEEIRVQGMIPQLGPYIVTVGVPWRNGRGWVSGAVLLHISTQSLVVDYSDIIADAVLAAAGAMLLGVVLACIIARTQSAPLRQIQRALIDFSQGRMDTRVSIRGDRELEELAEAFNQMAEDLANLERSRRSFVANVSHELRSPLTCIRGYAEGMLDGTIEEADHHKYLGVVRDESKRLTTLVNDLLDLSRMESGVALKREKFDLCELLRQELITFEGSISKKDIEVEVELPEEPLIVNADPGGIRQLMTNLLDNAVKFTPRGGRMGLRLVPEGRLCRVEVYNSGPGIPPEDLPHIFERFYKVDKAHTPGEGTGLGLAIVQKILEQHGQKIRVSEAGGFTTFSFRLALAEDKAK